MAAQLRARHRRLVAAGRQLVLFSPEGAPSGPAVVLDGSLAGDLTFGGGTQRSTVADVAVDERAPVGAPDTLQDTVGT